MSLRVHRLWVLIKERKRRSQASLVAARWRVRCRCLGAVHDDASVEIASVAAGKLWLPMELKRNLSPLYRADSPSSPPIRDGDRSAGANDDDGSAKTFFPPSFRSATRRSREIPSTGTFDRCANQSRPPSRPATLPPRAHRKMRARR